MLVLVCSVLLLIGLLIVFVWRYFPLHFLCLAVCSCSLSPTELSFLLIEVSHHFLEFGTHALFIFATGGSFDQVGVVIDTSGRSLQDLLSLTPKFPTPEQ